MACQSLSSNWAAAKARRGSMSSATCERDNAGAGPFSTQPSGPRFFGRISASLARPVSQWIQALRWLLEIRPNSLWRLASHTGYATLNVSRCDLHIHSRYSARSEEWLFRRLDFPDSYSDPQELYRQLIRRGMDYITITDHDAIAGCLQIAHLPRTFISEQVTTYFPNDPCKLHILVWGISEEQHREIEGVRDNIFELQRCLQAAQIAHAVAHPLYSVNGKLEAKHLEQLILLFKHFEGINGLRDALLSDLAQTLFRKLTPEKIDELANRHNLAPTHAESWKKIFVGGSDDHGGQFAASAFTETPAARSPEKFLEHVRNGNCSAQGHGGTPLMLSHGFYNTVAGFIQDRFHEKLWPGGALLEKMFSRFMEGRDPTEFSLKE